MIPLTLAPASLETLQKRVTAAAEHERIARHYADLAGIVADHYDATAHQQRIAATEARRCADLAAEMANLTADLKRQASEAPDLDAYNEIALAMLRTVESAAYSASKARRLATP